MNACQCTWYNLRLTCYAVKFPAARIYTLPVTWSAWSTFLSSYLVIRYRADRESNVFLVKVVLTGYF